MYFSWIFMWHTKNGQENRRSDKEKSNQKKTKKNNCSVASRGGIPWLRFVVSLFAFVLNTNESKKQNPKMFKLFNINWRIWIDQNRIKWAKQTTTRKWIQDKNVKINNKSVISFVIVHSKYDELNHSAIFHGSAPNSQNKQQSI